MSRIRKDLYKCPCCSNEFEIEVYESINVSLDKELRELVLNESIYKYVCPACKNEIYNLYPILYHDMDNKFMVQSGMDINIFNLNSFINIELMNNDLMKLAYKDYKFSCAMSTYELKDMIIALENGLDPIITKLAISLAFGYFDNEWEEIGEPNIKNLIVTYIDYIDDTITLYVEVEFDDGKTKCIPICDFNIYYEATKKFFSGDDLNKILSSVDSITFINHKADCLIYDYLLDKEIFYNKLNKKESFAITKLKNNDVCVVYIPPMLINKVKVGDIVSVISHNNEKSKIFKCQILQIIKKSDYEAPLDIEDTPYIE